MKIKVDLSPNMRIETGPVTVEYRDGSKDWTGVFIRGDNAAAYAMYLELLLRCIDPTNSNLDVFAHHAVRGLIDLLHSSNEVLNPNLRD